MNPTWEIPINNVCLMEYLEWLFVCVQVDSGYSTTSAGTGSLIDGLNSDCHGKESFSSNLVEEAFLAARHAKVKVI